ncbi:MAG: hypothetical protein JO117_09355 [Verrucomicrobia bacterium]|nr:hypothetical protein [Verrucomicrobiota bacterium]
MEIADSHADFATACRRVLQSPEPKHRRARMLAAARRPWQRVVREIEAALAELVRDAATRRD